MLNLKEKQTALAQQAYTRNLIDESLMTEIITTKASYDLVELLFSLILGELDRYTAVKFIARICQYSKG